mmetsp:Transcript_37041/g.80480  ORF Transcript_37041/g.80480 Transcript_37041/m.80480 type:complete len:725 (+) Transcript_37041:123-2297(+)
MHPSSGQLAKSGIETKAMTQLYRGFSQVFRLNLGGNVDGIGQQRHLATLSTSAAHVAALLCQNVPLDEVVGALRLAFYCPERGLGGWWQGVPVRHLVHPMLLLQVLPLVPGRAPGLFVGARHGGNISGLGVATVGLQSIPCGVDVVFLELLLKSVVSVEQLQLILAFQETRSQRDTKLILLHRELEGDGSTHDLLELVEESRNLHPSSTSLVGANSLHLAQGAAELREKEGLLEVLEVLADVLVGRVLEVVHTGRVEVLLVAPRVHVQAVGVHGIVVALQGASKVLRDLSAIAAHVHVRVHQGDSAHGAAAVRLVVVDVSSEGLHTRERGIAVLVVHRHLVRDDEHEHVGVLAELLHNELCTCEDVHTDVTVLVDVHVVAIRARESRQVAPVHSGQRDDDVQAQVSTLLHELGVRIGRVDVVQADGVGTHGSNSFEIRSPLGLQLVRGHVGGVGKPWERGRSSLAGVRPWAFRDATVVDVPWVVSDALGEEALSSGCIVEEVSLDDDRGDGPVHRCRGAEGRGGCGASARRCGVFDCGVGLWGVVLTCFDLGLGLLVIVVIIVIVVIVVVIIVVIIVVVLALLLLAGSLGLRFFVSGGIHFGAWGHSPILHLVNTILLRHVWGDFDTAPGPSILGIVIVVQPLLAVWPALGVGVILLEAGVASRRTAPSFQAIAPRRGACISTRRLVDLICSGLKLTHLLQPRSPQLSSIQSAILRVRSIALVV